MQIKHEETGAVLVAYPNDDLYRVEMSKIFEQYITRKPLKC